MGRSLAAICATEILRRTIAEACFPCPLSVYCLTQIAKRLPRHNGYRTYNDASTLTQARHESRDTRFAFPQAHVLPTRLPLRRGRNNWLTCRLCLGFPTGAQIHPQSGRSVGDEEGLGPDWIIYKELVTTSRAYLRDVCAVEGAWVEPLTAKLIGVDVERLSGGRMRKAGVSEADAAAAAEAARRRAEQGKKREEEAAAAKKKADDAAVQAARERYLKRKASGGPPGPARAK